MEKIKIPVKIDVFSYLIFVVLFAVSFLDYQNANDWISLLIGGCTLLFVGITVFSIRYEMDNDFLYVYSFFYLYKKVEIRRIYKIEKTWNLISSPAPSISGRVEIYWPGYNSVVISPKNFDFFKTELLKRNPEIEIKV
jgi:hypothetical protein